MEMQPTLRTTCTANGKTATQFGNKHQLNAKIATHLAWTTVVVSSSALQTGSRETMKAAVPNAGAQTRTQTQYDKKSKKYYNL